MLRAYALPINNNQTDRRCRNSSEENGNNLIQSWSHNVPLMLAVQSVDVSGMVEVSDNNMSYVVSDFGVVTGGLVRSYLLIK